ncbi:MAG: integrin alpha, partial [Acidimicrobiia bacterium]|nr:integrin alpha [Acidimicrobiia bacterium]
AVGFVESDVDVLRTHVGDPNDSYGWVGAELGDIDGDGVEDYAVTAVTEGTGGFYAGAVFVYSGTDGSLLHTVFGETGELLGYSAASAGDVDGDGTPDYVIGAPGFAAVAPDEYGRALVISGSDHTIIHEFSAAEPVRLGTAVSGAGDIDGDGHDDIVVGAENAADQAGMVTAYSGADGSVLWSKVGKHPWDLMGSAVDAVGDVNGDGVPDQVVGAYGAAGRDGGAAGSSGRGETYIVSGIDGSTLFRLAPRGDANVFGRFFARGGSDYDRDGVNDVFVADYAAGRGGPPGNRFNPGGGTPANGTGAAYLFSGATGKLLLKVDGQVSGEGLGPGRPIGDANDDGIPDLLVASWTSSEGAPAAGLARIYSGDDGSVIRTITSATLGEFLGVDALDVGDLDGDGAEDYLITGFGVAYVIAG